MTKIEWARNVDGSAGRAWNPTSGCDRCSPGCDFCYALTMAARLKAMGQPKYQKDGDPRTSGPGFGLTLHPDALDVPLKVRKPTTWFVNSMSDLFHDEVPDEFIIEVLAVMRSAPRHTYQVLTKRPQRMARLLGGERIAGDVARAGDRLAVRQEIASMGAERQSEIDGYPGYLITDRGRVLLRGGSESCVWCGTPIPEGRIARAKFCSPTCNAKAHYEKSMGRWIEPMTFREMRPDAGDQGHRRIAMVGMDGEKRRELVHRLVLDAFDRVGNPSEQACHRDGDPANNALPNLRWGTQAQNWSDRSRHGHGRTWSALTAVEVGQMRKAAAAGTSTSVLAAQFGVSDTHVRNIIRGRQWAERPDWPLPSLWTGTSIENDRYTFRAKHLRATPAAVRFLSCEPLLGPLPSLDLTGIDWVIVGAESGRGARSMDDDWVRDLRDRSKEAGAAFFFKQRAVNGRKVSLPELDGRVWDEMPRSGGSVMER